MSKWDQITIYKDALGSRYTDLCHKMMDLVAELREHPDFADVHPFTSLFTLVLEIPGKKNKAAVLWPGGEYGNLYQVYIEDSNGTLRHHFAYVNREEVIPKLQALLTVLRNNMFEIQLNDSIFEKLNDMAHEQGIELKILVQEIIEAHVAQQY